MGQGAVLEEDSPAEGNGAFFDQMVTAVDSIYKFAEDKGCCEGNSLNLDKLVDKLGGKIFAKDFWRLDATETSLKVGGVGKFEIFVPQSVDDRGRRFAIAHELGHYFLHAETNNMEGATPAIFDRYADYKGNNQKEANWFAVELLIPTNQLDESDTCKSFLSQDSVKTQDSVKNWQDVIQKRDELEKKTKRSVAKQLADEFQVPLFVANARLELEIERFNQPSSV